MDSKNKLEITSWSMNKWFNEVGDAHEAEDIYNKVRVKLLQNPEWDEPFFVANLQEVLNKHKLWKQQMPGIDMFYATKANDDDKILALLAALGTSFDCASKGEVEKILELGVSPDQVMYSNPYKMESHLKIATALGIRWMVCDSPDELRKIALICPQAKLVIRILPRKESTEYLLMSTKFGCRGDEALELAALARELGVKVHGISFYVGHCTNSPKPYVDAISVARDIVDAARDMGHPVELLDLGGGFQGPADKSNLFLQVASSIRTALSKHFGYAVDPKVSGLPPMRFVGEPGQFMGIAAFEVYAKVIGVKQRQGQGDSVHQAVYISSGHFGCIPNYNFKYNRSRIRMVQQELDRPLVKSSFWGPTCDPMDSLVTVDSFPTLQRGDWLRVDNMGAYTRQLGTKYNGFQLAPLKYFFTQEVRTLLERSSKNIINSYNNNNGVEAISNGQH